MRGWWASLRAAASRSESGARPLVSLSGLPGVTSHHTRSSPIRRIANRQAARWAACGGSKVPPNNPMRMPRVWGGKIGPLPRSSRSATGRRESVPPLMISRTRPLPPIAAGPPAASLEHDPEKWVPVFGKDHAQTKALARITVTAALRSRLSGAAYAVFEAGQLFDSDRSTGVEPSGGNADLGAEAELAALGELRRRIVQHDRRVDLAQEFLRSLAIFGHDRVGMMRAIALDMRDRGIDAIDHPGGENGVEIFGAPVLLGRRLDAPIHRLHRGVATDLAAGIEQHGNQRPEQFAGAGAIDQQRLGGAADAGAAHFGVEHDRLGHG